MLPSSAVTLTTHILTILAIHIAHLAYIKAILIARRDHPQCCSLAGRRCVGPLTATSNMLCNIQTEASLTSLPGPPMHMQTLG